MTFKVLMKDGQPKPGPYATVGAVVFDSKGRTALLHRGKNVRSAKNCWSVITGLHEEGLSFKQQLANEIREEIGVEAIGDPHPIGFYENIVTHETDNYHWVILMFVQEVEDLDKAINQEPDKHDDMSIMSVLDRRQLAFHPNTKWSPGLGEFLQEHKDEIAEYILAHIA